jgi:septum formation protein
LQQQAKRFRLVLASGSPRRREILSGLGIPFDVIVADPAIEEAVLEAITVADAGAGKGPCAGGPEGLPGAPEAVRIATALAEVKARGVLRDISRGPSGLGTGTGLVVLGADTVVAVGEGASEQVLGKPADPEDAARMLRVLSGREHFVVTAVAAARPGAPPRVRWETSRVRFRELSSAAIREYVSTGEPMGKAGAYAIQGRGASLVAGFSGCFQNIVGLPLVLVARMLEGAVEVPSCECARHPLQEGLPGCR